jgi:hypothetical protein
MKFKTAVSEKIENYIYVLKDPRNSTIFYVGKGKGNRIFAHISDALESSNETDKLNLIREILNEKLEVEHYILRHGLTKEQAFEIESACIDLLGLENLTNIVKGHNSWERGIKTVHEVIQHYDAKIITISEPSIIININKLYKRFMTDEDLYNSTKQAWILGTKKKNAKYVIAAYRGLVREIYEIENWYQVEKRWGFNGKIAPKKIRDKYLNNSLENYIQKGNQNPIRYTF